MKYIYIVILIILQIISYSKAFAQCSKLSQNICLTEEITANAETEKFYWVGTNHGLYCMRKKCGKIYHMTSNNSNLLSDTITSIAARSNGEVYIGTHHGIIRYDNYAFLLITSENSHLQSNNITSLVCLYGTEIFAGTFDGGITVFSDTRSKTFTTKNSPLTSNHIISLERSNNDSLVALLENNIRVGITSNNFFK